MKARQRQEGTGSVRFVFRFRTFRKLIGSVRFGNLICLVRRASASVFWTRRGSVRFGSVPRPVPAGSRVKRFGSVRFGRFDSVSYSFLDHGFAVLCSSVSLSCSCDIRYNHIPIMIIMIIITIMMIMIIMTMIMIIIPLSSHVRCDERSLFRHLSESLSRFIKGGCSGNRV